MDDTKLRQTQAADLNLGVNDGQTMPQFHFHVIPRRAGDVADPRGGVRWVIPEKATYWDAPSLRTPKECTAALEPIEKCTRCLRDPALRKWIHESCLPVPGFGKIASERVKVATVGLNPSSTEFFLLRS